MSGGAGPNVFAAQSGGVRVRVWLTPGASRERVLGIVEVEAGAMALKVAVAAPAESGRANAALLALLAREWGLPKRSLVIASGATSRRKAVVIGGEPATLMEHLSRWAEAARQAGQGRATRHG